MKLKLTLVSVLAVALAAAAGCGGSDSSSTDTKQDEADITALVNQVNEVTKDRDAQGFCALMQPSGVEAVFDTQSQCVRETRRILVQPRGKEPLLQVENISVDGDKATVELANDAGGAPVELVKEGGKWYVPLSSEDSPGATGSTDE